MSIVSQVNHARRIVVGVWLSCLAVGLIIVTSPICWMINYNALGQAVKRYGIDTMALLSIFLDVWMSFDTHPVRGAMIVIFCMLMSILQHPADYFD